MTIVTSRPLFMMLPHNHCYILQLSDELVLNQNLFLLVRKCIFIFIFISKQTQVQVV